MPVPYKSNMPAASQPRAYRGIEAPITDILNRNKARFAQNSNFQPTVAMGDLPRLQMQPQPAPQPGVFLPPVLKLPPPVAKPAFSFASSPFQYDLSKPTASNARPQPKLQPKPNLQPTPKLPTLGINPLKTPTSGAPSPTVPQMMPDVRAAQTAAADMADIRATVQSMTDFVNNPGPNPKVTQFYDDIQEGYENMVPSNYRDMTERGQARRRAGIQDNFAMPTRGVDEALQRKLNNTGRVGLSDNRSRSMTNPGSYSLLVEDRLDKIETPMERSERIYQERDQRRRQANVAAGRAPDEDKVTFGSTADANSDGAISPQEQRDVDQRMRDRRAERYGFATTPEDKAAAFQSARAARLQRREDALALRRDANAIRGGQRRVGSLVNRMTGGTGQGIYMGPQMSLAQAAGLARENNRRQGMEDDRIAESRRRFDVGAEEAQQRLRNERRSDRRRSDILQGELDRKTAADEEAARQFDEQQKYNRRSDRRDRREGREAGDLDQEIKQYEFDRMKAEDERADNERMDMGTPEKLYQTQAQARAAGIDVESPEYIATAIDGAYADIQGPMTPEKLEKYMSERGVPPAILKNYITGAGSYNDYTGFWDSSPYVPSWMGGEDQTDIDRQSRLQSLYGVK